MSARSFIILFQTLLLAVSCGKEDGVVVGSQKYELTFRPAVPMTKAPSDESSVASLDVLVFRSDGVLDSHGRAEASEVHLQVSGGMELTYYLVANAPASQMASYRTLTEFLAGLSRLEDNTSVLCMVGSGSGMFTRPGSVSVNLDRLMCRVVLESVTAEFLAASFRESEVYLDSVYLINVNGTCPFGAAPSAGSLFYNRCRPETGLAEDVSSLLCDRVHVLLDACTFSDTLVFYCQPNPVDNDVDSRLYPGWCLRNTRLVVVVTIDGERNYYPVTLPSMQCNTSYEIRSLILKGPGSSHPDIPVERQMIDFIVTVNPWEDDVERIIAY